MMLLHEPDWDSNDAAVLREFLLTAVGRRVVENLVASRPTFLSSSAHPHKSFACSREIHGYEQAVKKLLSLIEDQPLNAPIAQHSSSIYPDLEDESKWQSDIPA